MLSLFGSFLELNVHEIGTKKVPLIPQASHAVLTYAEKAPRMHEFFSSLFCAGRSCMALTNGG